ncbi:MAG: hypothetical protein WCS73_03270 [Lentisphaeria bacterium]
MNTLTWFILNIILITGAFYSTKAMKKTLKQVEITQPATSPKNKKKTSPNYNSPKIEERSEDFQKHPDQDFMNTLWEKTLFKPDRTENQLAGDDNTATLDQAKQEQLHSQFELVGLLRVKNDTESPIAIIEQKVPKKRTYTNSRYRRVTPSAPVEPEQEKPLKRIFRIGDPVNDSGFKLTDISLLENQVTLKRGTETLELKIQLGDSSSTDRKDTALQQAEMIKKKHQKTAVTSLPTSKDKQSGSPPEPPQDPPQEQPTETPTDSTPLPENQTKKLTPQQIRAAILERQKLLIKTRNSRKSDSKNEK